MGIGIGTGPGTVNIVVNGGLEAGGCDAGGESDVGGGACSELGGGACSVEVAGGGAD